MRVWRCSDPDPGQVDAAKALLPSSGGCEGRVPDVLYAEVLAEAEGHQRPGGDLHGSHPHSAAGEGWRGADGAGQCPAVQNPAREIRQARQ